MRILCRIFGHKYYSPVKDFDVIYGDRQAFVNDNPYLCLRCGKKK